MNDKEEYLKRLDKIQRDLDWITRHLLQKNDNRWPDLPPYNPNYPGVGNTSTCNRCGLDFSYTTSYSCQDSMCPLFTKTVAAYTHEDMHLDPDKRSWEYSGDGRRVPKGEAE